MTADGVRRKLTAILSADAVGYSLLMARDEAATVKTLNAHRGLVGGLVRQHGGRVVDAVGDNLLAEFPSVVDAVACAIAVQHKLAEDNAGLSADRRMPFRIGIHVGDVIFDDERIYGDGVNIAARLEALAEPGSICISGTVHEHVRRKLAYECDDLGELTLKNIADPVRAYSVRPVEGDEVDEAAKLTVPGFAGRPAVAVLAFDNLSGDPEQDYFADGIAEDLITRLSAFRLFPVIARNSSFTYKGKAVDVKQISRELGVRYVVEGSVRKAGDRVRVSAQLIDATSGHHVWAERYDRDTGDVFVLQDEITEAVFASMHPELQRSESQRATRRDPQSLDAWEYTHRGWWHFNRLTKEDNEEARSLVEKAIVLDSQFVWAYWILANVHYCEVFFAWTDTPVGSVEKVVAAARKGVATDDTDPFARMAMGLAYSLTGQRDEALAAFELALRINPSLPLAHHLLGSVLAIVGRPIEGIAMLDKAIRLSPQDPWIFDFFSSMAVAHFATERYKDAVVWAQRSVERRPGYPPALLCLVASLAHLGRLDEARKLLGGRAGEVSRAGLEAALSIAEPALARRFFEGLNVAGWKED